MFRTGECVAGVVAASARNAVAGEWTAVVDRVRTSKLRTPRDVGDSSRADCERGVREKEGDRGFYVCLWISSLGLFSVYLLSVQHDTDRSNNEVRPMRHACVSDDAT